VPSLLGLVGFTSSWYCRLKQKVTKKQLLVAHPKMLHLPRYAIATRHLDWLLLVFRLQVSAIAPFASELTDPDGVCFQEASAVTDVSQGVDNQGDDGGEDEQEDIDAELQALVEVVQTLYTFAWHSKSWQRMTKYIWRCRRLVRTLPRLTLIWEILTMLIRSVLTAAVISSCQADMQVYSSVSWCLCQPVVCCRQKLGCCIFISQATNYLTWSDSWLILFPLLQTSDSKAGSDAPNEGAEDLQDADDDADMTDAEDAAPATEADNTGGDTAGDIEAAMTPALQGLVQMLLHQHSSLCSDPYLSLRLLIQSAAFSSVHDVAIVTGWHITPQQQVAPRAWQQRCCGSLTCARRDNSLCCHAGSVLSVCGIMQDADTMETSVSGSLGDTSADVTPDASLKSHPVPVERPLSGARKGASGTASSASTAAAASAAAGAVYRSGADASKPVFKSKKRQVLCKYCKPLRKHLLAAV